MRPLSPFIKSIVFIHCIRHVYGVRLAGIDLNLLTSLDAILEERNLTRAAKRLGVSQPAASHALRRLRELLGDDLLVRTPRGMEPTPRAVELRPMVRSALEAAERVLEATPAFDPTTADRLFTINAADQAMFLLLPPLMTRLAREAPGVRLHVRPSPEGLGEGSDLAVGVYRDRPAGVRDEPLWTEEFVCVLRRNSAATRGTFDLARYLALPHLLVAPRGIPGSPLDDALARAGKRRNVALTVPHFLVAPHVVATTDLVWTAPVGLARAFADHLPLVLRDPPMRVDGFTVTMRWHQRLDRDAGLSWLRARLREAAGAA